MNPSARKRARTGCLTCRGRRRKCDEQKPECANCLGKGLKCQYRTKNLTFVASKFQDAVDAPAPTLPEDYGDAAVIDSRGNSPANAIEATTASAERGLPGVVTYDQHISPGVVQKRDGRVTGVERRPPLEQNESSSRSILVTHNAETLRRHRYELELIAYFRYHVAPILDLGLRDLWFGVTIIINSKSSETTYHAILAAAASRRGMLNATSRERDLASATASVHLCRDAIGATQPMESSSSSLLIWRQFFLMPIERWASIDTDDMTRAATSSVALQERLLLAQLSCAAWLSSPNSTSTSSSRPSLRSIGVEAPTDSALMQLSRSLDLLLRLTTLLSAEAGASPVPGGRHAEWQLLWQQLQQWYSQRAEPMTQIIDLSIDHGSDGANQRASQFPQIVFTSHAAILANAVHHVTSFLLLQKKPRLLRLSAGLTSSSSAFWHLFRALGIITEAAQADFWDMLSTSSLLFCSQFLSSVPQLQAVKATVLKIQSVSGLQLSHAVTELERKATAV